MRHQTLIAAMLLALTTCSDEDPCVEQILDETGRLLEASYVTVNDDALHQLAITPATDDPVDYFLPYMANALLCERGTAGACGGVAGAQSALNSLYLCLERR
jgi:hypothetical protein